MLEWLALLDDLFPRAVELAIKMPPAQLDHCHVLWSLRDNPLVGKYPEEVARLVARLGDWQLGQSAWGGADQIFHTLLQADLPEELGQQLREVMARLGISSPPENAPPEATLAPIPPPGEDAP